jgi:hypothetical protein
MKLVPQHLSDRTRSWAPDCFIFLTVQIGVSTAHGLNALWDASQEPVVSIYLAAFLADVMSNVYIHLSRAHANLANLIA